MHFNPATYLSYGSVSNQNSFNFDDIQQNPKGEVEDLFFAIEITKRVLVIGMKLIGFTPWEDL